MLVSSRIRRGVTSRDEDLYDQVSLLVSQLCGHNSVIRKEGKKFYYSCHSICRALALHIPDLTVIDGVYISLSAAPSIDTEGDYWYDNFGATTHSWLVTPDGAIIEPYPVSFVAWGPLLIPTRNNAPESGAGLYVPKPTVTAKVVSRKIYRQSQTIAMFIYEAKALAKNRP